MFHVVDTLYAIYMNSVPIENKINGCGLITSTGHFVTNYAEKCFKAVSVPVGFSFQFLGHIPF